MGDELGKREDGSNNRRSPWADISSAFNAQINDNIGAMDLAQNAISADISKAFNAAPIFHDSWKNVISAAYSGAFQEIAKPITPFIDVQDIMGATISGFVNATKPWGDTNVLGASAKSNWLGASAVIGFSMNRMFESQHSFINVFAANIGAASLAKTFNFNVLQGLSKHVEFKSVIASTQWTRTVEEPLRDYLSDDPFPEIQELAEALGIDELDEEQQAVVAEIQEARPEIVTIVTASPGYSLLSPQQRILILGIVTIAVWCIVAIGVVYVETEVPWLKALLEDIELTPTEAANKASAAVGGTGTLGELIRHMSTGKEPEVQPDN